MLAHVSPVGTVAMELDLPGLGEQSIGGVGYDPHHLAGELSLQQFKHRADVTGALPANNFPI